MRRRSIVDRGFTYRDMERYTEAVSDFAKRSP